jgi:hypothetical protein
MDGSMDQTLSLLLCFFPFTLFSSLLFSSLLFFPFTLFSSLLSFHSLLFSSLLSFHSLLFSSRHCLKERERSDVRNFVASNPPASLAGIALSDSMKLVLLKPIAKS